MEIQEIISKTKLGNLNENIITNMYKTIFRMVVHLTNIGYFPRSLIMILTPDTIPRYHGLITVIETLQLEVYTIHHHSWVIRST